MFRSGISEEEMTKNVMTLKDYKMVFTTPEMLLDRLIDAVVSLDREQCLARIVFDEAHTFSTWGTTFRPQCKDAAEKMAELSAPKLLLSATVSHRIQEDLKSIFGKDSLTLISHSVFRDNLTFEVLERCNGSKFYDQLRDFILDHNDESGIIYCVIPNDVAKIHAELCKRGVNCVKYHGQLSDEMKCTSFEKWMNGEKRAIVANSSFVMGIDKSDVRYIIHVKLPTSIEEYYQQCGRTGRDGLPSTCKLFYDYADKMVLYKLFSQQQVNTLKQHKAVNDLIVLVENPVQCRHKLIMNYFEENRDEFVVLQTVIIVQIKVFIQLMEQMMP